MYVARSSLIYNNNRAELGGALYLDQTSKIYFYKVLSPYENTIDIEFYQNIANYGGAVYISDDTASSELCENKMDRNSGHSEADCFIQILRLGTVGTTSSILPFHYHSIHLIQNVANMKGGALFGGLFDRCSLNNLAQNIPTTTKDYYKAIYMMVFDSEKLSSHIASNPAQVCFCTNVLNNTYNCATTELILSMRRGETFKIGITAIDHIHTQLAATIAAKFSSNGGVGVFKNGQTRQTIEKICTEVEYNVYSMETEVQLDIYADGPCSNKGLSKRILKVTFQPCVCPVGFKPTETKTECLCDCDEELYENVHNCSVADETLLLSTNTWIGYVNDTYNNTGFIMQTCPYDYCLVRPINISFTAPNGLDMQCAFNRSNLLCGDCEEGSSLVLGSSRCMICTNKFLSLMILFALLGVLLVVFILILNMTVAAGEIHGLIFYANIIGTQSIFFANHETDSLKVFISWLNLDFGIETCFYNGMDSYAKILLQLTFPSYLILLTITIIILCEHSQCFAKLLGSRNPVATLCTLILLSYSKLLNIIIGALQFTYIHYPNGTYETVWLYDANVSYFETSHIPRFVVASIVLALGVVYTVLLFFGQWLPRFSNWRILRWSKHPKYNAFIDAYHSPFAPKHRYWVGLLLLARIVYNLVVSLKADDSVALILTAVVALFLILLKMLHTKTYKNWAVDFLENTFFINLIILSLGTFYIRESNNKELPLIAISIAITFLTFLAIFCTHFYQHLLRESKVWKKLKLLVPGPVRRANPNIMQSNYQLTPILSESDQDDTDESDVPDLCPDYTQTEDIADTNSVVDRRYDPPIIQSALNFSELRCPYMDILDPVTPEHYKDTIKKEKTPKPATTTVVHGPRQN